MLKSKTLPLALPPDDDETRPDDMLACEPVPMKKAYSPGLRSSLSVILYILIPHVFGRARNFLVAFHTRFAAANAAKRTHLKLSSVAFLLQFDQSVIGSARAIGDVEVKNRTAILHMILRRGALKNCVPMLAANTVCRKTRSASASFGATNRRAFDENKRRPVLPIDAHFGRREIGINRHGSDRCNNRCGRRRGVNHHSNHGIADVRRFEVLEAIHTRIKFAGVCPVALRILAMMISSEMPACVISTMS